MSESVFDAKAFLKTLTHAPGVYRMVDASDDVLYVGKAKDLKRRVSSYFSRSHNARIHHMVAQIHHIEIIVTHTEAEALILENNLIKSMKPRYNILLRDDKSYPYIHLSDDEFPRLAFHRGSRKGGGRFFGPYPSASAVRETLQLLQKLFPVRQCENSFYQNRSRPCLQFQIKRCSGPCTGEVTHERYQQHIDDTVLFLQGKTSHVVNTLMKRMDRAASELAYEEAARIRDQIQALRAVQEKQYVSGESGDLDIIACAYEQGTACIQQFFIRSGRNLGNKHYFPKSPADASISSIMAAFISQYYLGKQIPAEILVSHVPDDLELLQEVLSSERGKRVVIRQRVRAERARWLKMASRNALISLHARLTSKAGVEQRLEALQQALQLDEPPERMECFDISHTSGQLTVASCVVFDQQGPRKSDYRRFNIEDIQPGDDYAAMSQALQRRYRRVKSGEVSMPDILFIDGGKGQLNAAAKMMQELALSGVLLVGIAKGPDRRPGMEQLFLLQQDQPIIIASNSPALHLVQQIRDESHRFAITGHRNRRGKSKQQSTLQEIAGIGPKRRQRLLKSFGGLQQLQRAGVEDIAQVDGISKQLAKKIYDSFHGEH
ncbi:MAG: excinuclease ABC subunit UvrC [Chromatiales bacterium]|jgi:excinuclease ABC subunit C